MIETTEFNKLKNELSLSTKRRLILWAARWIIGFIIIGSIVHVWPGYFWLWWAGGIIATISLAAILGMYFYMRKHFAGTQSRIADYEKNIHAVSEEKE